MHNVLRHELQVLIVHSRNCFLCVSFFASPEKCVKFTLKPGFYNIVRILDQAQALIMQTPA